MASTLTTNQEIILKQLRLYIEECTSYPKSVNNYTDFRRINECLQNITRNHELTILDYTDPYEFNGVMSKVEEYELFQEYNKKGKGQYSNALKNYRNFLYARKFASLTKPQDSKNEGLSKIVAKSSPEKYRCFITAIKSKPFLLLAGISGTGKSRIVRELARSCWEPNSEQYLSQKPKNFEMIQVKPNWHDSSELIGYITRINGEQFVVGPFIKFIVKAMLDPGTPYFLCLDEMNLAPVEQYFAEYLSVLETRKVNKNGNIESDPILSKEYFNRKYDNFNIFDELDLSRVDIVTSLKNDGLKIPQNLIVVGTVNMDETTFSFSRKVLDRAMTIEMNEVNLYGGLDSHFENIGKLTYDDLIGSAVEGVDVYNEFKPVCDKVIDYLQLINSQLEGTPFKIAYRTRNEFLLYVVNNLPYKKADETDDFIIARALDEITKMKILSRIEGDETKVSDNLLKSLERAIKDGLSNISGKTYVYSKQDYSEQSTDNASTEISVSLSKINEMRIRLDSGYTSFWG